MDSVGPNEKPNTAPDADQKRENMISTSQPAPKSKLREAIVICAIVSTQLVQMIPFGAGIVGANRIGEELGVGKDVSAWIAASYPLTQGAFVLVGGRIGALYGHKRILVLSGVWWVTWSLINGFMPNIVGVCIARGLTGVGGGFMVPNAIALIGINLPPGKSRNIAVGLFGAMAPIGAAGGSVFGGIFVQLTPWKWLFFFLAILGAVDFGIVALVVDSEERQSNLNESMDWVGAYLGVTGLILFNFVWNQAPSVGWQNPYEYALLIVALAHLVAFIAWEGKFAKYPLLPLNIWTAPSFGVLMIVALFAFMAFGALIWYLTLWFLTIRNWSLLLAAAGVTPLTVLGAVAAVLSSWLVPRLASQYILAIGALCIIVSTTLVATMPAQQSYWPQAFPAAILMAFCPDFIFTAAQIVASNSVGKDKQGIAGSLIGTIMTYGMSIGLGFAGTVEKYTMLHNTDTVQGYRNALYLAIGMGVAALVLDLLFVRVAAEIKEGWDDEQTSEF